MNIKINDNVFDKFPVLESDRLSYRAFEISDSEALFTIRSNDRVMKFLDTAYHQSEVDSLKLIENIHKNFQDKEGINWVITDKGSNLTIGYIGFWKLMKEHVRAEIGYALHHDFWGKGYMLEAIFTVLKFGFSTFSLHSVEANVNKNNIKSILLLERTGFVKEAHFRENYFYNGKFIDSIIYSLIETDFK